LSHNLNLGWSALQMVAMGCESDPSHEYKRLQ